MNPNLKEACATIELLASTWPNCFATRPADRTPLKVGIGEDIAAAAEGAITPEELSAALALYTTQKGYLKKLRDGATRIDPDGNPVGTVTAEQAAYARLRIEKIEARASARARARGLARRDAALKAKTAAEAARKVAEEARRAEEVAAGKRKPLLRLTRSAAASKRAPANGAGTMVHDAERYDRELRIELAEEIARGDVRPPAKPERA